MKIPLQRPRNYQQYSGDGRNSREDLWQDRGENQRLAFCLQLLVRTLWRQQMNVFIDKKRATASALQRALRAATRIEQMTFDRILLRFDFARREDYGLYLNVHRAALEFVVDRGQTLPAS